MHRCVHACVLMILGVICKIQQKIQINKINIQYKNPEQQNKTRNSNQNSKQMEFAAYKIIGRE